MYWSISNLSYFLILQCADLVMVLKILSTFIQTDRSAYDCRSQILPGPIVLKSHQAKLFELKVATVMYIAAILDTFELLSFQNLSSIWIQES
jgi:hypothetical protein